VLLTWRAISVRPHDVVYLHAMRAAWASFVPESKMRDITAARIKKSTEVGVQHNNMLAKVARGQL